MNEHLIVSHREGVTKNRQILRLDVALRSVLMP